MSFEYRSQFMEDLIKLIEHVNDANGTIYQAICEELI